MLLVLGDVVAFLTECRVWCNALFYRAGIPTGFSASGGARVITYNLLVDAENLLTIYGKGKQDSISKEEVKFLKTIGIKAGKDVYTN